MEYCTLEAGFGNVLKKNAVNRWSSQIVYVCFSYYGFSNMVKIGGTVNRNDCANTLEQHLLSTIKIHKTQALK